LPGAFNRKFEHALHCREVCSPTLDFVTNNNIVIVPHPPYSPDLASSDFALFPKLKIKLKGRYFETASDIKGNRKQYLTALRKMTFTVLLKCGKNDGITIYIPKETTLKEMAAKIEFLL
jgi:hypothetical protein